MMFGGSLGARIKGAFGTMSGLLRKNKI